MLGSYLNTFLDSFLSKEICCNPNHEKGYRKVIAKLVAKLEHLEDQESKGKRNVEQKGQLEKTKGKRQEETRKGNEGRINDKSNMK